MNTKRSVIITGGRAPAALELARCFAAEGWRVISAESQALYLSQSSRFVHKTVRVRPPHQDPKGFVDDLAKIIESEKAELLIPTCEEAFYVSAGKEKLSKNCRVWTDSNTKLHELHSKWRFNQLAKKIGLPVPASSLITNSNELKTYLKKSNSCVLKPEFSRFASKTLLLRNEIEKKSVKASPSPQTPWVAQDLIEGREFCTYGLARDGKLLVHSVYSHDFTAGKGAGICFEAIRHPKILDWITRFVSETSFTGQIAFDFIESKKDGLVYALECNPRATSGIHLFDTPTERRQLVAAFAGDMNSANPLQPQEGLLRHVALAMWLYGLPTIRTRADFLNWVRFIVQGKDVLFKISDPLPIFHQLLCFAVLAFQGLKSGTSAIEASTADIEWNGGEIIT